jgi:hypothetical protein
MANTARITQSALELITSQSGTARLTQNAIEYITGAGIACNNPSNGRVSQAYTHTLLFGGGTPPYTFTITAGSLPTGLTLNASTGVISGIPTANGSSSFTIQIMDTMGTTSSVSCSIEILSNTVQPAPVGGHPFGAPGCNRRNEWDYCMLQEARKLRHIKFPPLCTIPEEYRCRNQWAWGDDFGLNAIPVGAVPFNRRGSILTPDPADGDQQVISLLCPTGYDGLIQGAYWFYTGTGFEQGGGDIVWRVQLNLRYLRDLGNTPYALGSIESPMPLTEGQVVLSGQRARVLVNVPNLSGTIQIGASNTVAGLIGFFWPRG